jgi:hypothetical protein
MLADKLQTATRSHISLLKELQAVTTCTVIVTTSLAATTEQIGVAVRFLVRIPEVLNLNSGRKTGYPDRHFMFFLRPSM